jgi:cysteine desulfurase/selenocysteine lyase
MTLPERLRCDFPILSRAVGERPLVYLDNAATTQKPRAVLQAMQRFYERSNGNPHRGVHRLAEEATAELESARAAVRAFLGGERDGEAVFTRGTTEAINLVALGWAAPRLREGDEILITELEHHSNLVPWQRVAQRTRAALRVLPVSPQGELQLGQLERLISPRTRLVAFALVSNALGTILPAARLVAAARSVGAAVLVDAAQGAAQLPIDARALGADFIAFSGHKLLGPTGIGALWARRERLEEIDPVFTGGGTVREVTLESTSFREPPWGLEAGTPPVAEAVGLRAALEYLRAIGMEQVREHERALAAHALARLAQVPHLDVYGPASADERAGVFSFNLRGVHPHDLASWLDLRGICVRAGHHCAQPLMRKLGVAGTARASVHVYNTLAELDALADALTEANELR